MTAVGDLWHFENRGSREQVEIEARRAFVRIERREGVALGAPEAEGPISRDGDEHWRFHAKVVAVAAETGARA